MIDIPKKLRSYRFIKVNPDKRPKGEGWQLDEQYYERQPDGSWINKETKQLYTVTRKKKKVIYKGEKNNYAYTDKEFQDWIKHNDMYGILCGLNNLIVIDFDSKYIQDQLAHKLPKTYTNLSAGKGLMHKYYLTDNPKGFKVKDLNKNTLIDVQGIGNQIIGTNSMIKGGKKYINADDSDISFIKMADIEKLFEPYNIIKSKPKKEPKEETDDICKQIKAKIKVPDILSSYGISTSGDNTECPFHDSKGGRCFSYNDDTWHCFDCLESGNIFHLVMKRENLDFIQARNQLARKIGIQLEQPKSTSLMGQKLKTRMYKDFEKLKADKDYIIESLFPKGTVIMFCSPPKKFKSLIINTAAVAVTNARKFLGLKTKKVPVLISDRENTDQVIKERLEKIRKGLHIRKKDFPLYFLERAVAGFDSGEFMAALVDVIKEKKIKLFIIDTLHRHSSYDENSANDINKLYTEVLQPLRDTYGVTVVFLHHTKKNENDFRGSGDFLGMVDLYYTISREGKSNKFTLINKASRYGEIDNICGEIEFNDKNIKLTKTETVEPDNLDKLKALTDKVKTCFSGGDKLKRKDIEFMLQQEKYDYSLATLKRSLKWLVKTGQLLHDEKRHEYSLYGAEVEDVSD